MKTIQELNHIKNTIDNASIHIHTLENENENLKIMLWRLIKMYGGEIDKVAITTGEAKHIAKLKFYIDEDNCITYH